MIVRRWRVRVSDVVRQAVDDFCAVRPGFRTIWDEVIWRMEFSADKHAIDQGDGHFTASLMHSPVYPLVTLYFRFDDDGETILILDVSFHQVH